MSSDDAKTILDGLSNNPVLGHADPATLSRVAPLCRLVRYRAGRRFIREGEEAGHVYALIEGGCRVFHRGPDDEVIVVKLFGAPVFFGESDCLLGIDWLESVETVMPSVVVEMPKSVFETLLRRDHAVSNAMVYDLAARLLIATEQARSMAFGDAETRIAGLLLDYVELFGRELPNDGGQLIDVRLSQDLLAKSLSISRKTVQRTLQKWKDEELLGKHDAKLVVRNLDRLHELCPRPKFGLAYKLGAKPE